MQEVHLFLEKQKNRQKKTSHFELLSNNKLENHEYQKTIKRVKEDKEGRLEDKSDSSRADQKALRVKVKKTLTFLRFLR